MVLVWLGAQPTSVRATGLVLTTARPVTIGTMETMKSFLTSLPGILGGIAAVIAAITGLYIVLYPDQKRTISPDTGENSAIQPSKDTKVGSAPVAPKTPPNCMPNRKAANTETQKPTLKISKANCLCVAL